MSMYSDSVRAFLKPILPYLDDPDVSEIMINGAEEIWIEKRGLLSRTDAQFSDEGLLAAARNIGQYVGRVLSQERPQLDARLPDGSRIHIVLSPVARNGPVISIRKFFKDKLDMDRLISFGSATAPMARLIEALVQLKLSTIIAGGSGSGKTTLLNVVTRFIPLDERIVTIEDSAELQLEQPHIVPFESRPPDKFGKGEVTLGDLLNSALRLRPDRVLVGEVRGGEAFYLLQAMNTGVDGSMCTTHASTPVDTLRRLETLSLMGSSDLPMVAVRAQVTSALNIIVCCARLADGSRKVTHVSEVLPLTESGEYRTQDLFVYTITGKDEDGRILGYHAPTGILPTFMKRLETQGFSDLDEAFFDPATYGVRAPSSSHGSSAYEVRWAPSLRHRAEGLPDPEPTAAQLAEYQKNEMQAAPTPAPVPAVPVSDIQADAPFDAVPFELEADEIPLPAAEVEPAPTPVPPPAPSAPRIRVPGAVQPRKISDEETDPHMRNPLLK